MDSAHRAIEVSKCRLAAKSDGAAVGAMQDVSVSVLGAYRAGVKTQSADTTSTPKNDTCSQSKMK